MAMPLPLAADLERRDTLPPRASRHVPSAMTLSPRRQVCARIAELVGGAGAGPALSAAGAAAALRVPVAVAQRHLLTAEEAGTLCRDEGGPEGLRFYRNFFAEVEAR